MNEEKNLWGGRFTKGANEKFSGFNRSFGFDKRLFEADIKGCLGHCRGLEKAAALTKEESIAIQDGLNAVLEKSQTDKNFFADDSAEDVHSFIESNLIRQIGDTGRKLHMGRSRNDQVATALRVWMREAIDESVEKVKKLQLNLIKLAENNIDVVMPGYTHLQRAQPILFPHWCLAYFEMLRRDAQRLAEIRGRVNIIPLGSAALAGTSLPIDRAAVAEDLGFADISRNSLDAVSDRDFCVEFVFAGALAMIHLSRLAEDIVLYCTKEFGFFELSDSVATGSSLMPQKKNPDSMELVRGKSGRVFGHLMGLLAMLKNLPLAYNKDMQEDKEAVFDAFDTLTDCLEISSIVLQNITVDQDRARLAASTGYLNATELADYLARRGMPFRTAHDVAGKIVLRAIELNVELDEMELAEMVKFSAEIGEDIYDALTLDETLKTKDAAGGTSIRRVNEALLEAKIHVNG